MPESATAPAAPSAPTAPAPSAERPTPPASQPGERAPSEFMSDIEGDFTEMDAGRAPAKRDETGKFTSPKTEQPKPSEKPPERAKEKPTEKKEGEVAPPEKPASEVGEEKTPTRMRELGKVYDDLKKKVKDELEPELQSLRAKVQKFESGQGEAPAAILTKLQALEKRNQELEQQTAYLDYTQSTEFKTKYDEPYRTAWKDAIGEFGELTVREADGEDDEGQPKFKVRQADENDLLKLANMKLSDMDAAASAMFGPSASRAIGHLQNIRKLSAAQNRALEEAKVKAGEWRNQRQVESQTQRKVIGDTWVNVNKGLEERYPKAFQADPSDPDDKASHTKGFALADLLFLGNGALSPEQIETLPSVFKDTVKAGKPLTEAQKVQLHALARLKMANHDRKVVQLNKARARIVELETELKQFEKSSPPGGDAGSGSPASGRTFEEETAAELAELDRKGR